MATSDMSGDATARGHIDEAESALQAMREPIGRSDSDEQLALAQRAAEHLALASCTSDTAIRARIRQALLPTLEALEDTKFGGSLAFWLASLGHGQDVSDVSEELSADLYRALLAEIRTYMPAEYRQAPTVLSEREHGSLG